MKDKCFNTIEDKIESIIAPIKITKYAKAKGNFIAKRVKEICEKLNLPTYEIAFYLLSEKEEAKKGVPFIRDIYIAKNQDVFPSYCNISGEGAISSLRDIRGNVNMRVSGWGHSHGDIPTFFSSIDRETFDYFLEDHRLYLDVEFEKEQINANIAFVQYKNKNCIQIGKDKNFIIYSPVLDRFDFSQLNKAKIKVIESKKDEVKYIYAIVFNSANDVPYTMVAYTNGNGIRNIENMALQEIDDNHKIDFDAKSIDEIILSRVKQIKNAITLSKEALNAEYEKSRKILDSAKEVAESFFSMNNENKSYTAIRDLGDKIESILRLKYDLKGNEFIQEKVNEVKSKINADLRAFGEYLVGKRAYISMINDLMNQKIDVTDHWPPWTYCRNIRNYVLIKNSCNLLLKFIDKCKPIQYEKNDKSKLCKTNPCM